MFNFSSDDQSFQDVATCLSRFLTKDEIATSSLVSKNWNKLFNHSSVWQEKLKQKFGITNEILNPLTQKLDKNENNIVPKTVYKKLCALNSLTNRFHLASILADGLLEHEQDPLFLACCADDDDYFFSHADSIRDFQSWCLINIYAGNHKILQRLLASSAFLLTEELAVAAIRADNCVALALLLPKHTKTQFSTTFLNILLNTATNQGHYNQVRFLLDPKFKLQPTFPILCKAITSGNLDLVKPLLDPTQRLKLTQEHKKQLLLALAKCKNPKIVEWVLSQSYELIPDKEILDIAALYGNVTLIKWMLAPENEFNIIPDSKTYENAIKSDNKELITLCLDFKLCTFDMLGIESMILKYFAKSGDLELTKKLLIEQHQSSRSRNITGEIICYAMTSGNLALAKWLIDWLNETFKIQPDINFLFFAVPSNNLALFKWLIEEFNLQPNNDILYDAAKLGNLVLVKWLVEKFNLQPDNKILSHAALSGNVELVKWLVEKFNTLQPAYDVTVLNVAVEKGHLAVANYLLDIWQVKPNAVTLSCALDKIQNVPFIKKLLDRKNKFNLPLSLTAGQFISLLRQGKYSVIDILITHNFDIEIPEQIYKKEDVYIPSFIASYSKFRYGLQKIKAGQSYSEEFKASHKLDSNYFYHLVEIVLTSPHLKLDEKVLPRLLKLEIVQHTPFPASQYILAQFARSEQYLKLAPDVIEELFIKAREGFKALGQQKGVEVIDATLMDYQPNRLQL